MAKTTKSPKAIDQLIAVANELQEIGGFEPPIKTKGKTEEELKTLVTEAAAQLDPSDPNDAVSEESQKILASFQIPIGGGGEEAAEEEEEEEAEEEEVEEEEDETAPEEAVVTKKKAKAAPTPKKEKEPAKFKLSTEEKVKFFSPLIESGKYTTKDLVTKSMEKFPGLSDSSVRTFLVDSKNPKYNKFSKLVVADEEGKLTFSKK